MLIGMVYYIIKRLFSQYYRDFTQTNKSRRPTLWDSDSKNDKRLIRIDKVLKTLLLNFSLAVLALLSSYSHLFLPIYSIRKRIKKNFYNYSFKFSYQSTYSPTYSRRYKDCSSPQPYGSEGGRL